MSPQRWGEQAAERRAQASATCERGHRVVSFVEQGCDAGHAHRVFACSMRVGRRGCGSTVVVPPYGSACDDDADQGDADRDDADRGDS